MSEGASEYADVTEMFGLRKLEEGSVAYRRQREEIVQRTLPLANHIARRFRNRGEPNEDLVQAARVGLVNAVNRFDPENGADFLAFAVPTMMGEVRRHFRDYGWAVKVPRRLKDLQGQMVKARNELSQEERSRADRHRDRQASRHRPGIGGRSDDRQQQLLHAVHRRTGWAGRRIRAIGDTLGDVDPNLDKVVDLATVRPLIAALPVREQTVLTFGFSRT